VDNCINALAAELLRTFKEPTLRSLTLTAPRCYATAFKESLRLTKNMRRAVSVPPCGLTVFYVNQNLFQNQPEQAQGRKRQF